MTTPEVTDEMIQLVYERIDFVNHGDDGIREGLEGVLAVVARDRCMEPRGHVYHPLRREQTRCGVSGPDGLTCKRGPDHDDPEDGNHAASDGDGLVQW